MRYRTKTIEVQAFEYNGSIGIAEQIQSRFPQAVFIGKNGLGDFDGRLIVQTANGPLNCGAGDFVIQEPDGSLSVMNRIAFGAKYERLVEAPRGLADQLSEVVT